MSKNFPEQLTSIKHAQDVYSRAHGRAARAVFVDIYQQLAQTDAPVGTPVLTGFHAGSWKFSVDRINPRVASRRLKALGKKEGRRTIPPPRIPESELKKHLNGSNRLFLTNYADVIVPLNEGKISQKSPARFVEKAIDRAHQRAGSLYRGSLDDPD